MLLSPDKTGFPMIVVPEAELEVHLLPVTKLQIEQFITESPEFGVTWYKELLALNPPISYHRFKDFKREGLFISGILPAEAEAFAAWMGDNYDVPTLKEWRAIYANLRRKYFPDSDIFYDWAPEPVATIIKHLLKVYPRQEMRDITLMRGGLAEWVQQDDDEGWFGLGAPRPHFQPNLWDPEKNPVKVLHLDRRLHYFGFRLIRRGQWDVNKKDGVYIF